MGRKAPRADTLKRLYALSGNECAFPGCIHPIFNDSGLYIAELCHIEAANANGERYNTRQTDHHRNSADNLLFLCHRHHKETDDVIEYTVERLKQIKIDHENRFSEGEKFASNEMIRQIKADISYYWNKQKGKDFEIKDLKIMRDFDKGVLELIDELEENISLIKNYCDISAKSDHDLFKKYNINTELIETIPYYENPLINRNWEMHNIGRPNLFSHIFLCTLQLKIKILEELVKSEPKNTELYERLSKAQLGFEKYYDESYYVD
jgi:hypothetical protein